MNTGTEYSGLRCTRREFDQVAGMRVEGVSISATTRLTSRSRHTVARWLERASKAAERFSRRMLRDFEIVELQADELLHSSLGTLSSCAVITTSSGPQGAEVRARGDNPVKMLCGETLAKQRGVATSQRVPPQKQT